ncbi:importin subunit alpha-2-like [Dendronephthya gigantea]|uniref:importin subunit alpha-2-like n=1 Tax=Dendronephthya gigantea TaxID=151771 RepID=UPI00106A9C72|nr:importin subunit alpha-2-like [Dendronephthya gigantea]
MERKHLYKTASETVDKLRTRKREEHSDLRKEKRDKLLSLKRLRYDESSEDSKHFNLTVEDVVSLSRTIQKRGSDSLDTLRKLKRGFTQDSLIVDTFVTQDGALQSLVRLLTGIDVDLQTEAAWCFTNLAGSTQKHAVRILKASGAYLITYLRGSNVLLQDLCAWTLGNLAGDCEECKKIIMDQGGINPLVHLLRSSFSNVVQSASFAICNLARSNDEQIFEDLRKSEIGTIVFNLCKNISTSPEVVTEMAWILTYMSASTESVEYLYSCGISVAFVVQLLVKCIEFPDSVQVVTPLVRTLGNMCSGPDQRGEEALGGGVLLKSITSLLSSSCHHVRKESLWLLSNLVAGSMQNVSDVLNAGLLPVVVQMLDGAFDIRKESIIILLNIAHKSEENFREIINLVTIEKFLLLLKSQDNELCFLALQFFEMMLRTFPESREAFEKTQGVSHLEALQYNRNDQICQCVNDLMTAYFDA